MTKLNFVALAVAFGVSLTPLSASAQNTPKTIHPPHSWWATMVEPTALFTRLINRPNGSPQVVMFEGYQEPVAFPLAFNSIKGQNGCFTQQIGYNAIKDIMVYCTMYIWDYKTFVGTDPNLRSASQTGSPHAQWGGSVARVRGNLLFARNNVRYVSGPATIETFEVQSGIVRNAGEPGVDHGMVTVSFKIKPTAATGSVVVSIDADPRTNNTGTSDDFSRTISW
jgi:hypothetical protein